MYEHLGAEYYNVARALVDGRGFSDPFGEATGPTAWMPPIFPALLALCLSVFESRHAAAAAIITVTNVALVFMGVIIYAICRRWATRISPLWGAGFYLLWITIFNLSFFRVTHDVWLNALLLGVMCLAVSRFVATQAVPVVRWGVLAGVAALVSPAVAAAWAALTLYLFWRVTPSGAHRRQWLLAGALALAIAAPWTVRNALVFERFVPTKSNAGFELYLGNVAYPTGIYDARALLAHPYNDPVLRFQYAQLRESEYVAMHQREFFAALKAKPADYLGRVLNRFVAATLVVPDYGINPGLMGQLSRSMVHVAPLLMLLCSIRARGPNRSLIVLLSLLWFLYLTPYILVAFYVRYLLPLTPVFALVFFLGLDELVRRNAARLHGTRQRLEAWLFPQATAAVAVRR